jgi:hypothetical protein
MQRLALEAVAVLEKEGIIVNILPVPLFDDLYNEDDTCKQLIPVRVSADPVIIILHSSGTFGPQVSIPGRSFLIDYRFYRATKAHPDAQ